jgi:hypothetical protein
VVSEAKLENGIRLLLANRPGSGAVHAAWFIRGGQGDTAPHPPEAADMLLSAWFAQSGMPGASGLWLKVGPEGMARGRDIPAEGLEGWCRTEFGRLRQPIAQEEADAAMQALMSRKSEPGPMSDLFALALKENSYAQAGHNDIAAWAAISKNDLTELAKKYVAAGRLMIVLAGDVTESEALKALEGNFGTLEVSSGSSFDAADAAQSPKTNASDAPPTEKRSIEEPSNEKRRIEISSETATEVLVAWKIPPLSANDGATLAFFAEMLNGNADSWLNGRLVRENGCSTSVQAITGVPGLFIVRADVSDGHIVQEVEKAIQGAVQDSLGDDWGFIEINSAVNRLDAKHARRLADASGLAQELIGVYGSTGGWEPAVMQPSHGLELEQASIKSFLQPIFAPGIAYSVLVEQNPILSPRSIDHQRLISLLGQLLKKRGQTPESAENKIKETLRQFGLMPKEMRGQLFILLEAEVGR